MHGRQQPDAKLQCRLRRRGQRADRAGIDRYLVQYDVIERHGAWLSLGLIDTPGRLW